MIVLDDSSLSTSQKYFDQLESLQTSNPLYYVGPKEKELFLSKISDRLKDPKLNSIVRNLFRPSYGGNRNFTLIYTIGELVISSDDDMRPWALVANGCESLAKDEIARGRILDKNSDSFHQHDFDILTSFSDALGKKVSQLPRYFAKGQLLKDTAMDLETNSTLGLQNENSLILEHGDLDPNSYVKIAQSFRSGTSDFDALDFLEMFLSDEKQIDLDQLNLQYVLSNFRPVATAKNWRFDCGVSGLDNRFGLPPFFPTRLRFEDYIYRLWLTKGDIVSAHIDCAQHHQKSNYMRSPLASEIFNEEICNLLKNKIKNSITDINDFGIKFDYDGTVSNEDIEKIFDKVRGIYQKIKSKLTEMSDNKRKESLELFAVNLERSFYGFEMDFFHQNVSRIIDDVVSQIKGCLDLWQNLVEISFLMKHRQELPMRFIHNKKI